MEIPTYMDSFGTGSKGLLDVLLLFREARDTGSPLSAPMTEVEARKFAAELLSRWRAKHSIEKEVEVYGLSFLDHRFVLYLRSAWLRPVGMFDPIPKINFSDDPAECFSDSSHG